MKSKLLVLAGIALASALGSCAVNENQTNQRKDYNPRIMETTSTSGEVYTLSQEEAERQMLRLAWRSEKEDCWVYIKPEGKEGYLLDIGKNGVYNEVKLDSAELISHLIRIKDSKKDVTPYHIHLFKKIKNGNLEAIMLGPLPAMPSKEDYKGHRTMAKICNILNANLENGRAYSPSQRSFYSCPPDIKEETLDELYKDIDNQELSTEEMLSRLEKVGCTLRFESFENEQIEAALSEDNENTNQNNKDKEADK